MFDNLPIGLLLFDYALGVAMWTLIGRFGMSIFLPDDSNFFFMKIFVRTTDPMIRWTERITPQFLIPRLRPLYVAWFIFMFRFYILPLMLGYSVFGVLSFPLESEFATVIYSIGSIFR